MDRVGDFKRNMHYVFFSPKKNARVFKTVTYFLGVTTSEKMKLSEEHSGFAWLPSPMPWSRSTYKNAREILAAAAAWLSRHTPAQRHRRIERRHTPPVSGTGVYIPPRSRTLAAGGPRYAKTAPDPPDP